MHTITSELKKMEEKEKRVSARWKDILDFEKSNKAKVHISKYDWIYSIDHIWITFKSTKSPKAILQAFEPVHPLVSCLKALCCTSDKEKERA
jgi:hypothetical protein